MIYEYRVYEVAPGRLNDLHERFRKHTLNFFGKYDIKVVAFFTTEIEEADDRLIYILEFKDLNHREKAWANFEADPEWKHIVEESNSNGPLIIRVKNQILRPTDYSPLK
ncbi:MAG: NIPSNAP family protein [Planctomycetes bacterium]|nr:NIPSNAP family protein [Planctomycetota bacterium]